MVTEGKDKDGTPLKVGDKVMILNPYDGADMWEAEVLGFEESPSYDVGGIGVYVTTQEPHSIHPNCIRKIEKEGDLEPPPDAAEFAIYPSDLEDEEDPDDEDDFDQDETETRRLRAGWMAADFEDDEDDWDDDPDYDDVYGDDDDGWEQADRDWDEAKLARLPGDEIGGGDD